MGKKYFLILVCGFVATACNKYSIRQANALNALSAPVTLERPACEVTRADYIINTNIISYVLTDNGGVSIGFNTGGLLKSLGFNFDVRTAQMELSMDAVDPILNGVLGSINDVTKKQDFSGGLSLNLGIINIGGNINLPTQLSDLSYSALQDGLNSLAGQLQNESQWSAHVLAVPSPDQVVINAGSLSGIRPGDTFAVYNTKDVWTGAPCTSQFVMELETTAQPIAIMTATNQYNGYRILLQANAQPTEPILQGAKVVVSLLTSASRGRSRAGLKKQVQVGTIASLPIVVGGTEIDLVGLFKSQINSAIIQTGFTLSE